MSAAAPRAETLPVVLLHGWGMHGGVWADLVTRLGGSVGALAPDLPGHGHSPMVEPYDIDVLVDQIAGAAPARCTVAGWSLGGQLALAWARRHPQQVERLVLIGTTPCFVSAPDWPHGVAEEVFAQFATDLTADAARTLRRFLLLETRGDAQARAVARQLDDALAARPLPGREVLAQTLLWLQSTDIARGPRSARTAGGWCVSRIRSSAWPPGNDRRRCACTFHFRAAGGVQSDDCFLQ
jgi:pimeloyl-[acyl-carrier protein] methyl ester esterase